MKKQRDEEYKSGLRLYGYEFIKGIIESRGVCIYYRNVSK